MVKKLLIILAFLILPSFASAGIQDGLVGWWTMDYRDMYMNVFDRSWNGNNGYLVGFGATSTAVVAGKLGQGLGFTPGSDYVDIGNNSIYNFTSSDFSLSFWVKTKNVIQSAGNLVMIRGGYQTNGWYVSFANLSGKLIVQLSTNQSGARQVVNNSKTSLASGNWTHVVITRVGSVGSIYVNGSEETYLTRNSLVDPASSANNLNISASSGGISNASLDDVRIYSRALSATEIRQLWRRGLSKY